MKLVEIRIEQIRRGTREVTVVLEEDGVKFNWGDPFWIEENDWEAVAPHLLIKIAEMLQKKEWEDYYETAGNTI